MTNSRDTTPKRPEIEIKEGLTMDRFMDLTRQLLDVTREEVRKKEQEFKAQQRNKRNKK